MWVEAPRLLVTDDDVNLRETVRDVLEPRGFQALLAGDGEEAIRIVQHETVHVVLLDMHMPKLTGLETIRQVKQFRALLPCILMSAQLDETLIEQARQAQADSVLPKPLSLSQLVMEVYRALHQAYNWHALGASEAFQADRSPLADSRSPAADAPLRPTPPPDSPPR